MKVGSGQWSIVNKNVLWAAVCAMLIALCSSAEAQQPQKVPRIGYISSRLEMERREEAFQKGLRELGICRREEHLH
jgi:hypothetical protein